MSIMSNGIDATGIDLQPKENNNIYFALFFIAFMVVGSMLIVNLFVGVVIDNFNKIKINEELGNMFVTESQKKWIEIQRIIMRKKLKFQDKLPQSGIRYMILIFVTSRWFDWSITAIIFANTIVMSIRYSRMSDLYSSILENFNLAFAIIFNFEAIVKIIAFGKSYFNYTWNKFDLIIVIGTNIGLLMNVVNMGVNISTVATVVRAFRIMRIFRLVKSSQNMRIILDTISHILPQIMNIMSLVFLLLFIYSILGINLFAGVMFRDNYNERANFRTFEDSMLLLYRWMTGENWDGIMDDLALSSAFNGVEWKSSQSYQEMQHDGVLGWGTTIAYFYFVSYMILLSMIIMNLSVAAVIEGLYEANKENTGIVSGDQIDFLIEKWRDYDTNATGFISYRNFLFLLFEVPPPLGLGMINEYNSDDRHGNNAGYTTHEEDKKDDIKNIGNVGIQDRYFINEEKRIYIKKSDAIKIFNDYDIPLYEISNK